jgi:hypothetical protein
MSRVRLMLIALGVAFAVPALTGARVLPVAISTHDAACVPQPDPDYPDTRWIWRMRAYQHLDCVNAIVNRALQSSASDRIELLRADVERIRTEAWYARDAAARIGQ